ncbi:uncharacterized protein BDV17DRAFT_290725 [Aspergillus undulatus]|uniref:uncharacterized protein n=1 Tax=Aspergillus undulatus TaxID=1810928 RepID=UPI003CCDF072
MSEFTSFFDDAMDSVSNQWVDCQSPHMPEFTIFFDDAMDSLGDQWVDCQSPHKPEDQGKDFSVASWDPYWNQDLDAGAISFPNNSPLSSTEVSSIVEPAPLDMTGSDDSQLPWNPLCLDAGPDTSKGDFMLLPLSDNEQLAHVMAETVMAEITSLKAEFKFLKTLLTQTSNGKGVSGRSKARKTIQRSKGAITGKTPGNEQGPKLRRSGRKRSVPNYRHWTWLPDDECIVIDD